MNLVLVKIVFGECGRELLLFCICFYSQQIFDWFRYDCSNHFREEIVERTKEHFFFSFETKRFESITLKLEIFRCFHCDYYQSLVAFNKRDRIEVFFSIAQRIRMLTSNIIIAILI